MKISLDGLPGCRKNEIFLALKEKYNMDVNHVDDPVWHQLFISDPKKYALSYELNRLINFYHQYEGTNQLYNSFYSLKKIYVEYLSHKEDILKPEYEVFMKYYRVLFNPPDYIIYFYGTYENSYNRMKKQSAENGYLYSDEEYKKLHYLYEWVFDNNNCRIPIFKINIEDNLDSILNNLKSILDKIATFNE